MRQRARTDLCGGCRATGIPTATQQSSEGPEANGRGAALYSLTSDYWFLIAGLYRRAAILSNRRFVKLGRRRHKGRIELRGRGAC